MLTASSEPCIGTDGQVASISRENHAFCAGRADLLPDWSVKERLKRQHAKIRLRNAVPYGNLALNRPSLGGHLGNVGQNVNYVSQNVKCIGTVRLGWTDQNTMNLGECNDWTA